MNNGRVNFLEALTKIARTMSRMSALYELRYWDPLPPAIIVLRNRLDIVVKYGGIDLPNELIEMIASHFTKIRYQCHKCGKLYRELEYEYNGICSWKCVSGVD